MLFLLSSIDIAYYAIDTDDEGGDDEGPPQPPGDEEEPEEEIQIDSIERR